MAADTQRDQVFETVMSKFASELNMTNLEILRRAAILAAPAVSEENLPAKSLARLGV